MSDSKLDLIAQLLAKAESTTPEEAEALTEHAERLMLKYGIEQAMIDDRRARLGQTHEEIVERRRAFTGSYAVDFRELGAQVAFGLGTMRPLQSKTWDGALTLHLVGYESDVDQAVVLISSLQVQGMVAMRAWWKQVRQQYSWGTESEKRRARSGFLRGFAAGVRQRIAANRLTIIEETGSGAELVLVNRRDRIDEHIGSTRKARKRSGADSAGYANGYWAGQEANTGDRELTHGKALTT